MLLTNIACSHRKSTAGRLWGVSLLGVSAASSIFHASSGSLRPACRQAPLPLYEISNAPTVVGHTGSISLGHSLTYHNHDRRLDFWTIAASSNIMVRSIYPNCPAVITAMGIAATPFKPFFVSFINTVAMVRCASSCCYLRAMFQLFIRTA